VEKGIDKHIHNHHIGHPALDLLQCLLAAGDLAHNLQIVKCLEKALQATAY